MSGLCLTTCTIWPSLADLLHFLTIIAIKCRMLPNLWVVGECHSCPIYKIARMLCFYSTHMFYSAHNLTESFHWSACTRTYCFVWYCCTNPSICRPLSPSCCGGTILHFGVPNGNYPFAMQHGSEQRGVCCLSHIFGVHASELSTVTPLHADTIFQGSEVNACYGAAVGQVC